MVGEGPSGRPLSFSPTRSEGRGCGTVRVGRPVAPHSTTSWWARGAGPWELDTRNRDGRPGRPVTETSWPHRDGSWGRGPAVGLCRFEAGTGAGDGRLGPSHPGRPVGHDQIPRQERPAGIWESGIGRLGSGDWDRSTLEDQLVRGRPRDRPTRSGRPPRFEGGRGTGRDQTVRTGPGGRRVGRIVGKRGQTVRTGPVGELVQKSGFRPPAETLGRIKLRKTVPVPPTSTSWLSLPDPFPAMF